MRIVALNQSFAPDDSATAQHLGELSEYLHSHGHDVAVIADCRRYEDRTSAFLPRENWQGIEIHRLPTTGFGKRSFGGRLLDGLSYLGALVPKLLFLPRPDVVLSLTSPPLVGFVGAAYARVVRARHVQCLADLNIDAAIATGRIPEGSLFAKLLLRAFRWSLVHSDVVIVEDRLTKARAELRGASAQATVIIPPWQLDELSTRDETAEAAFRNLAGVGNACVVMYSGNHAAVHPLDTLLAAIERIDCEGFQFLFVGNGERVRDVSAAVQRGNLQSVKQLPLQPLNQLSATLHAADIHIVVMGNEMNGLGHPSKLYGVLATGKPYIFIGPRDSYAGDILAECPYGFAVEHGDVEGLVTALRAARDLSPAERGVYRRANIAFLQERFGRERSLAAFEAAIRGTYAASNSPIAAQISDICSDVSESDDGK
jgi:glycosyltransferase involved in cell wall biosynthesis